MAGSLPGGPAGEYSRAEFGTNRLVSVSLVRRVGLVLLRKLHALEPTVLGADALGAIASTIDRTLPSLTRGGFRFLPNGNVELSDPEAVDAVRQLRHVVESALPVEVREHVGEKSGLGWNLFFGHVVGFWLPQRFKVGFLRALADRAALHGVDLALRWNEGRVVSPREARTGNVALVAGTALGVAAGAVVQNFWPYNPALPLLTAGAGLVAGRWYQRLVPRRECGDRLCRTPLGHGEATCPSCGARLADRLH
jgi:hypothetical protein